MLSFALDIIGYLFWNFVFPIGELIVLLVVNLLLDIIHLPGNIIRTFILDRRPFFAVIDEVLEARKVHITAWAFFIGIFLICKYDLWGELMKL